MVYLFQSETEVVLTYPLKYYGHVNYVSVLEDAEPSGICHISVTFACLDHYRYF